MRREIPIANVDGNSCYLNTLSEEDVKYISNPSGNPAGTEVIEVISDDPYCSGKVNARALYEFLKGLYGES